MKRQNKNASQIQLECNQKDLKMQNSKVIENSDSDIDGDLPVHHKGHKNQWAAIMKLMDDEEALKVSIVPPTV